jgi:phosphatidate cytidylyltransferase
MSQKAATRATSAVVMMAILAVIFYLGHFAVCISVCALGGLVYRELLNVRYKAHNSKILGKVARFRTIQWLWFAVGLHFAYKSDFAKAPMGLLQSYAAPILALDQTALSFALYSIVFVTTVVSLRGTEEELRFQIEQLCWSIAAISVTVGQMKFSVANTYQGLFWIVFPGVLVAMNDTGAYISGKSCGKKCTTRLFFPLSPNKTWEGFIGAAIMTCVAGYFLPLPLAGSDWLRCSYAELKLGDNNLTCTTSTVFTPALIVKTPFGGILEVERFGMGPIAPIQLHGVVMGLFASLVAPFGGLFASVVKRAYGLKDFDNIM